MPTTCRGEGPGLSPDDLAAAYDRYVAARRRGEPADDFSAWLEAHWTTQPLPEPGDGPVALSAIGSGAHCIHWHARNGAVLGHVVGRPGGHYWVPVNAALPPDPATRVASAGHGAAPSDGDRLSQPRRGTDTASGRITGDTEQADVGDNAAA